MSNYKLAEHRFNEIEHFYGENVHILSSPYLITLLTRLSQSQTVQPELNKLIKKIYTNLIIEASNIYFNKINISVETRMKEHTDKGVLQTDIIDNNELAVVVDLARAGIYPSHLCFEVLHDVLDAKNLRQDHFFMNRKVNDNGEVIGVDVSGSKIGGPIDNAYVFLPDPMGATGGSLSHCINHYKKNVEGSAKKYVVMNLIITPEYIKRMQLDHPDVEIIAVRIDRGQSSEKAMQSVPGTFKEEESGLNETQYIVPGAGGVGEILNNSFV